MYRNTGILWFRSLQSQVAKKIHVDGFEEVEVLTVLKSPSVRHLRFWVCKISEDLMCLFLSAIVASFTFH